MAPARASLQGSSVYTMSGVQKAVAQATAFFFKYEQNPVNRMVHGVLCKKETYTGELDCIRRVRAYARRSVLYSMNICSFVSFTYRSFPTAKCSLRFQHYYSSVLVRGTEITNQSFTRMQMMVPIGMNPRAPSGTRTLLRLSPCH